MVASAAATRSLSLGNHRTALDCIVHMWQAVAGCFQDVSHPLQKSTISSTGSSTCMEATFPRIVTTRPLHVGAFVSTGSVGNSFADFSMGREDEAHEHCKRNEAQQHSGGGEMPIQTQHMHARL